MSQPNSHWFHVGKQARANGRPCQCPPDSRMSAASRSEWYAGWSHQDALMRPPPTQAEIDDTAALLAQLKASLAASEQ